MIFYPKERRCFYIKCLAVSRPFIATVFQSSSVQGTTEQVGSATALRGSLKTKHPRGLWRRLSESSSYIISSLPKHLMSEASTVGSLSLLMCPLQTLGYGLSSGSIAEKNQHTHYPSVPWHFDTRSSSPELFLPTVPPLGCL